MNEGTRFHGVRTFRMFLAHFRKPRPARILSGLLQLHMYAFHCDKMGTMERKRCNDSNYEIKKMGLMVASQDMAKNLFNIPGLFVVKQNLALTPRT